MTKQQVFNKVAKHLLRQQRKAVNGVSCVLRDEDGNRCAIGCLIPKKYVDRGTVDNEMGTEALAALPKTSALRKAIGVDIPGRMKFLAELQEIHDDYSVSDWDEELHELAAKNHLSRAVLR